MQITSGFTPVEEQPFEVVERKGIGHPDTLSDLLAEELSIAYSRYCLDRFGAILRHQFDKLTLMCGRSEVGFGNGRLVAPIRVLINGRVSPSLGPEEIPVRELLSGVTYQFFAERFPMLESSTYFRLMFELNQSTTGGIRGGAAANAAAIHYRFKPRSLEDLPETQCPQANDTSMGCAFAPFSPLELLVLDLEHWLNVDAKSARPWLGSDIKIMAHRNGRRIAMTVAAPVLSTYVDGYDAYEEKLQELERDIREFAADARYNVDELKLTINAGDDIKARKIYMNFTGSSIESGDEGQVGRGNRFGGVIAPLRPFTMEGISGKNPVYHAGKLYSVAAGEIASKLYADFNVPVEVYLTSQMGRPLHDPWQVTVRWAKEGVNPEGASSVVAGVLADFPAITSRLLQRRYRLA